MSKPAEWPKDINFKQFVKDCNLHSNFILSQKYGRVVRNIQHIKKMARGLGAQIDNLHKFYVPPCETPIWTKHDTIKAKRCLVLSDIEIPDHDQEILELFVAIAHKFGITTAILNGDVVKLDVFSTWARDNSYRMTFEDELSPMYQIMETFCEQFDEIEWTTGNHERRLPILVAGEITIGKFLDRFPKVKFSEYSHCNLQSGSRDYYVVHQKNYGRIPLSVPRALFPVHLTNIIAGHGHHQGICKDPSGNYYLIEGGSARSIEHTQYKNTRDTTHPQWNLGFTMIIDGEPFLINKENGGLWLSDFGSHLVEKGE